METKIKEIMDKTGIDYYILTSRVRQFKACQKASPNHLKDIAEGKYIPKLTLAAAITISLGESVRNIYKIFPRIDEKDAS